MTKTKVKPALALNSQSQFFKNLFHYSFKVLPKLSEEKIIHKSYVLHDTKSFTMKRDSLSEFYILLILE